MVMAKNSTARSTLAAARGDRALLPATEKAMLDGGQLLFHDTFEKSTCGWGQLVDVFKPAMPPTLVPYPASMGGGMALRTDNAPLAGRGGKAHAIKRLSRRQAGGEYIYEFVWGWSARFGQQQFRCMEFGLDSADDAGVRNFPKLRWMNYNDLISAEFPNIGYDRGWYVSTGPGSAPAYVPVKDGAGGTAGSAVKTPFGFNEGKLDQLSTAFHVSLEPHPSMAGYKVGWKGIRVGYTGYGSLADTPVAWNIPIPDESLAIFAHGFNAIATMSNLVSGSFTSSTVVITEARGVML